MSKCVFPVFPIIGMSPGNSYFKDEQVTYLLSQMIQSYGRAAVFVPDVPAISTYLALGYPLSRAKEKAMSKGRNLKNRARKCAERLCIAEEKIRLIDWSKEIEGMPQYREAYSHIEHLYNEHLDFQREANAATLDVLLHMKDSLQNIDDSTRKGVEYLLSELAFFAIAPSLLGAKKTVAVYHHPWPIYTNYIAGIYDGEPKISLDFLLLPHPNFAHI